MNFRKIAPIFLLAIASSTTTLIAQQFHVEKSEVFDEPDPGWNSILQLKNGNTFLFHIGDKGGINVTVYDKSRKMVSQKDFAGKLWDPADMVDHWLYEINGEAVVFLNLQDHYQRTLVRIRFNSSNGEMIKEEVVATAGAVRSSPVEFGLIDVKKDPASDCYAIVAEVMKGMDEKIKVTHYDGEHKKISEADYKGGGPDGFRYTRYSSVMVDGNKRVYLVLSGFREKPKYAVEMPLRIVGDSKIVVAKLNAGEKVFTNKTVNLNVDLSDEIASQMLYNKKNNQLELRTKSLSDSKTKRLTGTTTRFYLSLIMYIDPETLNIISAKPINGQMVNEYGTAHIDKDYEFTGVPNKMFINKDNTTSVIMEKTASMEGKSFLKDIGVSVLADSGIEASGYAIAKSQQETHGIDNAQFMSYDYISTPKGNYLLFNDMVSNIGKDEDDSRRRKVSAASLTNSVGYRLNNNSLERLFFFGEPGDNSSTFSYTSGTDYNEGANTYATIIIERTGRKKEARLAWVTFE